MEEPKPIEKTDIKSYILLALMAFLFVFVIWDRVFRDQVEVTYKYHITCVGANDYTQGVSFQGERCHFIGKNTGVRAVSPPYSIREVNRIFREKKK